MSDPTSPLDLTNPADLADLLVETGHHHHEAYQDSDGVDPEWALWYAAHLQSRIWDSFGPIPTRSLLVHLLLAAEEAHNGAGDDGGPWPASYASFMAERLG